MIELYNEIYKMSSELSCKQIDVFASTEWAQANINVERSTKHIDKEGNRYNIEIHQACNERKVEITSEKEVTTQKLLSEYILIEKLLMLFDGIFWNIQKIQFPEHTESDSYYKFFGDNYLNHGRLTYYKSDPLFFQGNQRLLCYDEILTGDLIQKWAVLLEELDIVHQVYLYNVSNNGFTHDVNLAHIIEMCEPLVEIINEYYNFFPSLIPGKKDTTLKMCVEAIISQYGREVFGEEYAQNKDKFLSATVNTRVRIMHIKRNFPNKIFFNGKESTLYIVKYTLLYRNVLLNILGIDFALYKDHLINTVIEWNKWQDVLTGFLER